MTLRLQASAASGFAIFSAAKAVFRAALLPARHRPRFFSRSLLGAGLAACLFFAVLFASGCVSTQTTAPQQSTPALLDDPLFMADIDAAGGPGHTCIALVAPSSGTREKERAATYALAHKAKLFLAQDAIDNSRVPYTANDDAQRLKLLTQALTNNKVSILWALRGGYGSSRLLEELARLKLPMNSPRIVVGYSDITFLHLFFGKYGWPGVHAAMFDEMRNPAKDMDNYRLLAALLSGRQQAISYSGLQPLNSAAQKMRSPLCGPLVGGNLTCLAAAQGSPWAMNSTQAIIFLEDVNEPGYKIDRMLTQLAQGGHFTRAQAVLLGSFTHGDEHTRFALERFANDCPIPVFESDVFGHGPKNYPLILNAPAQITRMHGQDTNFTLRQNWPFAQTRIQAYGLLPALDSSAANGKRALPPICPPMCLPICPAGSTKAKYLINQSVCP